MIGNNELHINTGTMIEAVELWLKSKMAGEYRVVNVTRSDEDTTVFVIKLESPLKGAS